MSQVLMSWWRDDRRPPQYFLVMIFQSYYRIVISVTKYDYKSSKNLAKYTMDVLWLYIVSSLEKSTEPQWYVNTIWATHFLFSDICCGAGILSKSSVRPAQVTRGGSISHQCYEHTYGRWEISTLWLRSCFAELWICICIWCCFLTQLMAFCLMAPSHYLNQCSFVINFTSAHELNL